MRQPALALALVVAATATGCGGGHALRSDHALVAMVTPRDSDFGHGYRRQLLDFSPRHCTPLATACAISTFARSYHLRIDATVTVFPSAAEAPRAQPHVRLGVTTTGPLTIGNIPGTQTQRNVAVRRGTISGVAVTRLTVVYNAHSHTRRKPNRWDIHSIADYVRAQTGRVGLLIEFDDSARRLEARALGRIIARAAAAQVH